MRNKFLIRIIKFFYKSHIIFRNEISAPVKLISIILLIIAGIIAYNYDSNYSFTGVIIAASIFAVFGLIYLITGWFIGAVLKNTGGKFVFSSETYFEISNGVFKLKPGNINNNNLNFSTKADAEETAKLNVEAFSKTLWNTSLEEKRVRNLSHTEKNNHSILLVSADNGAKIGFSHILATNIYNWNKYKDGLISDNEFTDNLLVPTNIKYKTDEPFGLILFSIAISTKRRAAFNSTVTLKVYVGDMLTKALAYHINEYCKEEFKHHKEIPILLQTMSSDVIKYFKNHKINGKGFSKDAARIIYFEIENPHVTPLPQ